MIYNRLRIFIVFSFLLGINNWYAYSQQKPLQEQVNETMELRRQNNYWKGSSRSSDKEFKRFVEIALGSSFELETQLIIIKYADEIEINNAIEELNKIQKQTNSFIQKLK